MDGSTYEGVSVDMHALSARRQTHLILHMLGIAVALAAIVTLPVCHASAFFPVTDGDARTITEQRDIVEVVSDPGVHLLHLGYEIVNQCERCIGTDAEANPFDGPQTSHVEDIAQRVATMPTSPMLAFAFQIGAPIVATTVRSDVSLTPEAPPPQVPA